MKQKRPPIVTVLGHVDHGKTTLLDAIRNTSIQAREAGGITQSIGASKFDTKQGQITFIDTPGHAAFSSMRSRGAKLADIAILVVAADDGPMPQTREALSYIREAEIPLVVAITKIDLPSANTERVKGQMEQEGVLFEGRGGDTPVVEVSARNKSGIDDLLEMIILVAEVNDISGDPDGKLDALVIETNKDKRGPVASVVVKNGTLKAGNEVWADEINTKVRGLFDYLNKPTKSVSLSEPAVVLGFTELPSVGSHLSSEKISERSEREEKSNRAKAGDEQVPIVLKANTAGALEAVLASLPDNAIEMSSGVGDVNESDVLFAKTSDAIIVTFESKASGQVMKLAETEGVQIYQYKIIYELLKKIEEEIETRRTKVLGRAEIIDIFPFNGMRVAGSKIVEGKLVKGSKLQLMRGEVNLGEVKIVSIRKQKQEVDSVVVGEECGILFQPHLDFEKGDMLLSVAK